MSYDLNCYVGNGAGYVLLPGHVGGGDSAHVPGLSLEQCRELCLSAGGCEAVTMSKSGGSCFGRKDVEVGSCAPSMGYFTEVYVADGATPGPSPTAPPTAPGAAPYCGIAVNPYTCREEVARLEAIDAAVGSSFERMCMGYGGTEDTCTLNINSDCSSWYQDSSGVWRCAKDYGLSKNPDSCNGRYFFLWDEPQTQGFGPTWAADQWKVHVDTWPSQMAAMRARGVRITSPLFSDYLGNARGKFQSFFTRCGSGCSDPNSPYYVDVLAMNQWLGDPASARAGQEQWIKDDAARASRENGNRPVILGNFAWLNGRTADQAADAITNSRIWDRSWSGLEAVFYFAAEDYGANTRNHRLSSATSSGSTVGAALVERCAAYNR